MKKLLVPLFILCALFVSVRVVQAFTLDDALLQIDNLQKELSELRASLTGSVLGATITTTPTTDLTPRISYWSGKVNQHVDLTSSTWQTDSDGKSGASIDKLTYCKKFYPDTTSVVEYKNEIINTWKDAGNINNYTSTKMSYRCVPSVCKFISQPSPNFCPNGTIQAVTDANQCITSYKCISVTTTCEFISQPSPDFCPNGKIQAVTDTNRCVTAYKCIPAPITCPFISTPSPDFCPNGAIEAIMDANRCIASYKCTIVATCANGATNYPACTKLTPIVKTLMIKMRGDDVKTLQIFLGLPAVEVDGYFGLKTQASVMNWQKLNGLYPDGIFGSACIIKAGTKLTSLY
jgi:hypothetical protein